MLAQLEQRLDALLPSSTLLTQAMRYALFGGGKRLRPRFLFATASAFGIDPALCLDTACAIEMVHTYSLIHDDLPCMDDDDLRRGRPTLHRVYPEAIALLAGDALLTEAFRVLARAPHDPSTTLRLIDLLSTRAGLEGMAEGQSLDVQASSDTLLTMLEKKTADLLSCSLESAALLAHAGPACEQTCRTLGLRLGLAYQIRDDLEDAAQLSDQDKPTSLTLLGPDRARALLHSCLHELHEGLATFPCKPTELQALLEQIFSSEFQTT